MLKRLRELNWQGLGLSATFLIAIYFLPCFPSQSGHGAETKIRSHDSTTHENYAPPRNFVGASGRNANKPDNAVSGNHKCDYGGCLPLIVWGAIERTAAWCVQTPEAFFGLWVAIFTGLLVWRAKTQEDANIAMERAYVFVTVHSEVTRLPHTGPLPVETHRAWAIFKNHGKTPAFLKLLRGYIIVQKDYPEGLIDLGTIRSIPDGFVIGAGDHYRADFADDINELMSEDTVLNRILCLGMVEYRDIFGKTRKTGFCWQFQERFGAGEFHIAPADHLNYHD